MADEFINLVEYGKGLSDPLSSGLIQQFGMESDVLTAIGFKTANQGRNIFERETAEPTVAFRAINADPEISHGETEERQDQCYPISGLLEYDIVKLMRYGEGKRALEYEQIMRKGSAVWTDTFISGDNGSDPKEFDGIQNRFVADAAGNVDGSTDDSRLLANATGSGGGALSLAKLDLAIDLVNRPSHILMSRRMKTKFRAAARDPALTNQAVNITNDMDSDLGRPVMRYNGIPILTGYEASKRSLFLPFNEVAHGGGSAVTSSIYVVSFREDGVCGINTAPPTIDDIGRTDKGTFNRDLFLWDCGITVEDHYSGLRLSSITDAAIVA